MLIWLICIFVIWYFNLKLDILYIQKIKGHNMKEIKKPNDTYCIMCLNECPHVYNKDAKIACSNCGTIACDGILERDEIILMLNSEKKKLADIIESLEHTQEQSELLIEISKILSDGEIIECDECGIELDSIFDDECSCGHETDFPIKFDYFRDKSQEIFDMCKKNKC